MGQGRIEGRNRRQTAADAEHAGQDSGQKSGNDVEQNRFYCLGRVLAIRVRHGAGASMVAGGVEAAGRRIPGGGMDAAEEHVGCVP